MKNNLVFAFFLLLSTLCFANKPVNWDNKLTAEQNIAANSTALKDSADLSFLNPIAKQKSIIILGEPGHYELKTTEAKINLIKYLKNEGFNSVAIETVSFLSAYVFSNPEFKEKTKNWKAEYFMSSVWTNQKTFQPLIDMLNKKEIKLLGIDGQLGFYDITASSYLLEKFKKEIPLDIEWNRFHNLYLRRLVFYMMPETYKPLNVNEEYELMNTVNKVSNYVGYIISKKGNTQDLKALLQWVQNVKNAFPYIKYNKIVEGMKTAADTTFVTYIERNRDEMMAKNVIWHAENDPKAKFTVWCANYHASKNLSQEFNPNDSLLYFTTQTMGEFLSNSSIEKKIYTLAITSKNMYEWSKDGKLELEIAKYIKNAPFAFVDFETLRFAEGYWNKTFNASIRINRDGKFLYCYDGLYYLRDQELNNK